MTARTARRHGWLCVCTLLAFLSRPAQAAEFPLAPGQDVVGAVETVTTVPGDTLLDIARRYDLGYTELVVANPGVDPWRPGPGRQIVLPLRFLLPGGPRRGIVVALAERRLFYFPPGGSSVETFPIGVAVDGMRTPVGETHVTAKLTHPVWYPPRSILAERPELPHAVAAGPDNPLGDYAFRLGWPNYLIHGTNKPDGIGRNVSHGCIHLYPEDIARLFREASIGTPVRVDGEPTRLGWDQGRLLLELHPDTAQADALDEGQPMSPQAPADLVARVIAALGGRADRVDWNAVERAGRLRNGIPVAITRAADDSAEATAAPVDAPPDPPSPPLGDEEGRSQAGRTTGRR